MFYDIVIIGAGPCGLAAAARLREKTPSALFTNEEHARYWKNHKRQAITLEKEQRRRRKASASSNDSGYGSDAGLPSTSDTSQPSMVVLEANSDGWMSTWNTRFQNLKIAHLRSPLFFHPDPQDRDGLLAYAHEQGRMGELREIPNVVGKELSKHESKRQRSRKQPRTTARHLRIDGRDTIDYFTPSTQLFSDYCRRTIERYKLQRLVQQAKVTDVVYEQHPQNLDHGLFTITTSTNEHILAKVVIIATGASSSPSIPNFQQLSSHAQKLGSIRHVFGPNGTHLPIHLTCKLKLVPSSPINIIIVGGGLTSVQLTDLLLRQYPTIHIHLFLRHSKLKCKPFDIDLPWVSKTRNHLMSSYWSADHDVERLAMLRKARNGGSVNSQFARILQQHITARRVTLHTDTELHLNDSCIWDDVQKTWTSLNVTGTSTTNTPTSPPFTMPPNGINHIIYCTGNTPTFEAIPFLKSLQQSTAIETLGGLPILNNDLMYSDSIPLFFTGALAALRLGPGAANLAGARQGAERITWKVEQLLELDGDVDGAQDQPKQRHSRNVDDDGDGDGDIETKTCDVLEDERAAHGRDRSEFTGSFSNQFAALGLSD